MSPHHNRANRAGQAPMVSLALYSAIIVVGISTVVFVGTPVLEDMQDAAAIDAAKDMLSGLETQVRRVAGAGEGSRTTVGLRFARGTFTFDADDDSVYYRLNTDAQLIGPQTSKQIGNLRLSSSTDVSVSASSVDGQDCWLLENEHISVCIRDIEQNATDSIGSDTVGYWRFNENFGSTVEDVSDSGNDGTINGATWVDGKHDNALEFDGSGDYVNVGDNDALDVSTGFTVSAWVYRNGDGTGDPRIVSKDSVDGWGLIEDASYIDGGNSMSWRAENTTNHLNVVDDTAAIPTGEWTHYMGVHNGSHLLLYRNGALVNTTFSGPVSTNNEPLQFGKNAVANSDYWNGRIDEVRIWDRTLSSDEVAWLHRTEGRLDYIDTEHLLLRFYNKDENEELNADMSLRLRTDQDIPGTNNGTGYVEPLLTGTGLGRGTVDANIKSFFGVDYTVKFTLHAGADFLSVNVDE